MARLVAITDPDTALGFRLAGIEAVEVASATDAAERLLAALNTGEPGVIIYNEDYQASLPEKSRAALDESITPVFFAVPVARAGMTGEAREVYLARLLRRAIGYQLKIKR